jgi:hypothetical protein
LVGGFSVYSTGGRVVSDEVIRVIEGVLLGFKFIDFAVVEVNENGTALIALAFLLEEAECAVRSGLIY